MNIELIAVLEFIVASVVVVIVDDVVDAIAVDCAAP